MANYFYIVGNSIMANVDSDVIVNFALLSASGAAQYYLIAGDEVIREIEIGIDAVIAMPRYTALGKPYSLINRRHIATIQNNLGYTLAQIMVIFGLIDNRGDDRFDDEPLPVSGSAQSLINRTHYQNVLANTGLSGDQIMSKLGLTDNR